MRADATMHPVIAHSQPSSSTLALAMKLLALLSVQPRRTLMHPESTVAVES